MLRWKLSSGLFASATILLLVVGTAALLIATRNYSSRSLAPGDSVSAEISPRGSWNLIAIVSPDCHFCTSSIPFYRTLASDDRQFIFTFAGLQPVDELKAYSVENRLRLDRYISIDRADIDLKGTPTLVLVSPVGTVERVWLGEVSDQEAVKRVIFALTGKESTKSE